MTHENCADGFPEAVSKLSIGRAFSPYACCCRIPGAAPQADIGCTFGPFKSIFYNNLSAEGAISYQPGAQPQEKWSIEKRGLKALSIPSFETASPEPSDRAVAYTDDSGESSSQSFKLFRNSLPRNLDGLC
jgi:hypothetical protein